MMLTELRSALLVAVQESDEAHFELVVNLEMAKRAWP
jgi:hypothetical protein